MQLSPQLPDRSRVGAAVPAAVRSERGVPPSRKAWTSVHALEFLHSLAWDRGSKVQNPSDQSRKKKIFQLHHCNHLRPSAAAERTEKRNPACYNASRKSGGGKPGDNDGPGHNKRWGARRSKCSAPIRPQLIVSRLVGYLRSKIDSPIRIRRLMGCFEPPSRGLV